MPNQRASKLMTISLPPSLYEAALRAARAEGRSNSEFVRESIRKYLSDGKWKALLDYGRRKAIAIGLRPGDIEGIVDGIRSKKKS